MNKTLIAIAATALLGACATERQPPAELLQARSAVRAAEMDAGVLASAPLELKKATDTLSRADMLLAKGEDTMEVLSAAYVAERQAKTAVALAQAKRNEEAIGASQADRERARADANARAARTAQAQAATAQGQVVAAQSQAQSANQQADAANQRANSAQVQAVTAQAAAGEAQQQSAQLRQRLSDLQAMESERGTLVTLGDVLFESGRAEVKPAAQMSMRKLADFLTQYPSRSVLIEGHTDNVGSASLNEALSLRRAEAVTAALGAMSVAPQRIRTVGYGKDFPIADNSTDTNRALNRRVEVYISSNEQAVRPRR